MESSGTKIDVKTADGPMDVYVHSPAGKGPFPTVILYFDAFGVRPAMHDVAKRLASLGYLCAVPNLFYRAGTFAPFNEKTVWSDPPERNRIMTLVNSASGARVAVDTEALIEVLVAHHGGSPQVGCFGYCMGGRLAFYMAGVLPSRVVAAASYHGGHIAVPDDPDSPHRRADKIKAKLYFGVADNDRSCAPDSQALLKEALDQAKISYLLEVYTGAEHGFAVTDSPAFNKAANEKHWERLLALFKERLHPKTNL